MSPAMLLYIDKGHVQIPVQQLVMRVAAYAQIRECVHIIKKKERALSVFQSIMCHIVQVQFLLIMAMQSNLKSFTKYA